MFVVHIMDRGTIVLVAANMNMKMKMFGRKLQ